MTDPFREQRISPEEVRRIVKRAVELAERDPDTAATEQSLTREELERAATTLGIPASAIARAAGPEDEDRAIVARKTLKSSRLLGAPIRMRLEARIAAVPTDADREEVVEVVRRVVGTGRLETVGRALTLHTQFGPIAMGSRDGRTHVVAEGEAAAFGFVVFFFVGMFAFCLTLFAALGAGSWLWLLWVLPAFLLGRILFMAQSRSAERTLRRAVEAVVEHSAGWPRPTTRTRIAAPDHAEAAEADAEEAEADAEVAAKVVRRRRR